LLIGRTGDDYTDVRGDGEQGEKKVRVDRIASLVAARRFSACSKRQD
jgi:hypothetical protein